MGIPVSQLQLLVTSAEFIEYQAYMTLYPLDNGWIQAAMQLCQIDNMFKSRGARRSKVEDFMPKREKTDDDLKKHLLTEVAVHNRAIP